MKFLKTLIPISLVALMFGISACDDEDFEDLNTNPNQPESVEPNLLLPGVIRRTTNNAVNNSFLSGNVVAQTATKTLRVEDELYILGSLPELWTTHYDALRDLENIKEQATQSVTINGNFNNDGGNITLSGSASDELSFESSSVANPGDPVEHRAVSLGESDVQVLIVPQDGGTGSLDLVSPGTLTDGNASAGSAAVVVRYNDQTWSSIDEGTINLENNRSNNVVGSFNDVRLLSENTNENYQGVALVMEAWLYSVLTDAYGDIPYDQALGGDEGEFTPEFTAQEEVYLGGLQNTPYTSEEPGIIALLDTANALLDPSGESISGDILYGGQVGKWKRLCNSLKLRLLTHLSSRDDQEALISRKMSEVAANPSQYPIFQGPGDNAVLSYLEAFPNQYPLIPLKIGDFDAVNLSKTAADLMKDLNDPRLKEYARPANMDEVDEINDTAAVYDGLENGFPASADEKSASASRLGYRYYDYPDHPKADETAKGIIMTNAELQFILAEARARGWINAGSAEDFYRQGIVSAMTYYDVSLPDTGAVTTIDEYYNQPDVSLSQASGQQERLEYIGRQKWLALWFHGLEPFFEVRRNLNDQGTANDILPFLSPAEESNIGNRFPYRYRYPGNAESLNQQEFQSALNSQGDNDVTTPMWLLE